MLEILRWVSLVLMWLATGLNVWGTIRGYRLNKRLKAERKYCLTMIEACNEFLEASLKEAESREEAEDEGRDGNRG